MKGRNFGFGLIELLAIFSVVCLVFAVIVLGIKNGYETNPDNNDTVISPTPYVIGPTITPIGSSQDELVASLREKLKSQNEILVIVTLKSDDYPGIEYEQEFFDMISQKQQALIQYMDGYTFRVTGTLKYIASVSAVIDEESLDRILLYPELRQVTENSLAVPL
ncbi:hypothetical protein HGA91_04350 [candidate division WWE3 bacterium]|nr:hypothetical protein [candidate division WWE3 bacterium]